MSERRRNKHSAEFKFKVVKEQMTTKTPVTEICQKYGISSGLFYKWQEQFFKSALNGFNRAAPEEKASKGELRKIAELEHENQRIKDVVAEIVAQNIELKKTLGQ